MLLIPCPWCGPRDEIEFTFGGEADRRRPRPSRTPNDAEWARYLYFRQNPRGVHRERWHHVHGCRCWFVMERDTSTHRIADTDPLRDGAKPPADLSGHATGDAS